MDVARLLALARVHANGMRKDVDDASAAWREHLYFAFLFEIGDVETAAGSDESPAVLICTTRSPRSPR